MRSFVMPELDPSIACRDAAALPIEDDAQATGPRVEPKEHERRRVIINAD
jgi:hypothetical protein